MKNILKGVSVFIGAFVGAGFASGQEIVQYFAVYGKWGIAGAFISSLIFGGFCYITLKNARFLGEEYLPRLNRNFALKWMYSVFMLIIFCTMVNASGEALFQVTGLPKIAGSFLSCVFCLYIVRRGKRGVVMLNTFAAPLIVAGILILFLAKLYAGTVTVMAHGGVLGSALVYVSYNTITLASLSGGISDLVNKKGRAEIVSTLSGSGIFILILCMWYILYNVPQYGEIPILDAVWQNFKPLTLAVLLFSMVTTAVANGFGFAEISVTKMPVTIMFVSSMLFSLFPFSFAVDKVYGFFGVAGIFVMADNLRIFVNCRKNLKKI